VPITLLGSSGFSAQRAGMLGLPFAFAAHSAPEYLRTAVQLYRKQFRPNGALRKPHLMMGVQLIAIAGLGASRCGEQTSRGD